MERRSKNIRPTMKIFRNTLTSSQWDAIHSGMREVVSTMDRFQGFDIPVAGKTGTAQQTGHANHGLFIGYAPYDDPEITIAVRMPTGYSSHNAAPRQEMYFILL